LLPTTVALNLHPHENVGVRAETAEKRYNTHVSMT
jgi:hypothetical protein